MDLLSAPLHGRLDQIAVLVPDLEDAMDTYIANFGVTFGVFEADDTTSTFSGSSPRFRIRIAVALAGLISIELIQPVSGVTLYSRHLESHGAGVHHLGVYAASLAKARRAFRRFQPILEGRIRGLGKFAYFEVPGLHCIVELLQLSVSLPLFLATNAELYTGRSRAAARAERIASRRRERRQTYCSPLSRHS